MGFFDRLRGSTRARLLNELAELVGSSEELTAKLKRHADRATPNLTAGLRAIAEKEAEHLKRLKTILAERDTWPRPPERSARDGNNNWERLGNDLAVLGVVAAGLHRAAAEWEGVEPAVAEVLAAIAVEDDGLESELRKLALKCDPQALD